MSVNYSSVLFITDEFQVIPLRFSRNLDRFNPNIPEWREDIGQVVNKKLAKVKKESLQCKQKKHEVSDLSGTALQIVLGHCVQYINN